MFLSDELFQRLAERTNAKVATMLMELDPETDVLPPILTSWRDCTASEMKKLVGMHLYMGLNKKSELHDY